MKVKIKVRKVYHKIGEVEIDIPNMSDYDIQQYLNDNENLWFDQIEDTLKNTIITTGLGMDDGNWVDSFEPEEWRFEIDNFRGHL